MTYPKYGSLKRTEKTSLETLTNHGLLLDDEMVNTLVNEIANQIESLQHDDFGHGGYRSITRLGHLFGHYSMMRRYCLRIGLEIEGYDSCVEKLTNYPIYIEGCPRDIPFIPVDESDSKNNLFRMDLYIDY